MDCFPVNNLSQAFGVIGDPDSHTVVARFLDLVIRGEQSVEQLYGYNLLNGIFYFGLAGAEHPEATGGQLVVSGSTFEAMASGTTIAGLDDARVMLRGNLYREIAFGAVDVQSINHSAVMFSHNSVNPLPCGLGIVWYDPISILSSPESRDLTLLVNENIFEAHPDACAWQPGSPSIGVFLDAVMTGSPQCLIIGNEFPGNDIDVLLGPQTTNCLVNGWGLSVADFGTDNTVIERP